MNLTKMDIKRIMMNTSCKFIHLHAQYKDCYQVIYNEAINNKFLPDGQCIGKKGKSSKITFNYDNISKMDEVRDKDIQYIKYLFLHEVAHAIMFKTHPEYFNLNTNKELYDNYYLHTDEFTKLLRSLCKEFKLTRYQDFIYTDDDRDEEQYKRAEMNFINKYDIVINEDNEELMNDFLSMNDFSDYDFSSYEEFITDSVRRFSVTNFIGKEKYSDKFSNDKDIKQKFNEKRNYWLDHFTKTCNFSKLIKPRKITTNISKLVDTKVLNGCLLDYYEDVIETIDLEGDIVAI